ncbi:MAG: glycosyltransferase family 4 protein [Alphaproteobacteria bacterium]|nr:glycosyltransferase family 4 protein [Alphaproteobacteria bacterium]
MRIAFYASLKPPDHPTPSGDRRMARLLLAALREAGHEPELASRFRSYDGAGNPQRQMRLAAVGLGLAKRLARQLAARPFEGRPRVWITYHLYYKAPDWLGPRVASALGIPYVLVEASFAAKRAGGLWSTNHAAVEAALGRAAAIVSMHESDEAGVAPVAAHPGRLHRLKPFLDPAPFVAAVRARGVARRALAQAAGLSESEPWLIAIGMMRPGDKLASYSVLGRALQQCLDRPWRLIVVGDGAARAEVHAALAPLGDRVVHRGLVPEAEMPGLIACADLCVWPAINEAYGMALLEAHAAAVPVVAGDSGGVSEIVRDGRTGWLVPPGDADAFAAAVNDALSDTGRLRARGTAAWAKVGAEHNLAGAGAQLDRVLNAALRGVP